MSERVREEVIDLSAQRAKNAKGKRRSNSRSAHSAPTRRQEGEDFQFMRKQAARRARVRRNRLILLGGFVLLIALGIGLRIALTVGIGYDSFYEGVSVDGLQLKGYTKQEAIVKLNQLNQQRIASTALKFSFGDQEWTVEPTSIGAYLDIEEQVELAWQQGREGNIFQRQSAIGALRKNKYSAQSALHYDLQKLEAELVKIKEKVDVPAQNASVDFDPSREEMFRFVDEQRGREVPLDGLMRTAIAHLDSGMSVPIAIEPAPVEPTVFREDLVQSTARIKRVTTPLGESKAPRIHNIKLALSMFNGMVLAPGQEVSFNEVTGPRGLEQGYQNAGVILDDEIVDGPGGGVCQVSTTLYQALVRSGLQIVKRSKHSLPVSYVPVGTDAAVNYGSLDLVFKNNTESPVFLVCEVSGSSVSVTIYGRPLEDNTEIKIVNDVYETIPAPEPETIPDTAGTKAKYTDETVDAKKSREGYRVRTYAVWYKDSVETERVQLTNDYYHEVKGTRYVGVTPRPAQDPTVPVIGGE